MQINVTYDSSVESAPAGFESGVAAAVQFLDAEFTNAVTINIDVGYGEVDGESLGQDDLGESLATNYVSESYTAVRNALIAQGAPGSSTLPTSSPDSGTLMLASAEAKALGLLSSSGLDGYVGFSSEPGTFSYASGSTPPSSEYYFVGTVEHEITEDMGRVSLLDEQPHDYSVPDLFRYSAVGVRDLTTGRNGSTAYFSINGGTTNLGSWNNNPNNGDLADWYGSNIPNGGNDAFNDYSSPGVINAFSSSDITLMEALGWTTAEKNSIAAPTLAISSAGGSVYETPQTISGTIDTADSGLQVSIYDGSTLIGTATPSSNGVWGTAVSLLPMQGAQSVTAQATNAAGGVGTSNSVTYSIVAPTLAISSAGGSVYEAPQTISGTIDTADSGLQVSIYDGSTLIGTATPSSNGVWSAMVSLLQTQGVQSVTAKATDAAGLLGTSNSVTYDVTPYPQNPGNNDEWILSDGQWAASAGPGSHPSGYNVAGIGDWTGKGTDGVLWYDPTTGDTDEWQLSNTQWSASVDFGTHPGSYQIAGVGDFTGNGISDVLWTSSSNGQVQTDIWELGSNGQWDNSVSPGSHPAGYQVAGIGDFTGNGTDDILWQNPTTGDVDEWQLSNGQLAANVDLGSHPGSGWQIAGIGDFTGNGIDDVLWTNSSNGQVQTDIWELGSNGQWVGSISPGSHPASYQVAGIGNFTGNSTSDILWQELEHRRRRRVADCWRQMGRQRRSRYPSRQLSDCRHG